MKHILVVGNGLAGMTAAIRAAELGCNVTVASKAVDENGNKIFTGKAWMNKEGLNEIRILIYRNSVWRQVGTLDYMACIY